MGLINSLEVADERISKSEYGMIEITHPTQRRERKTTKKINGILEGILKENLLSQDVYI